MIKNIIIAVLVIITIVSMILSLVNKIEAGRMAEMLNIRTQEIEECKQLVESQTIIAEKPTEALRQKAIAEE